MPKKCGIATLYYHDFAEKIRANPLKKCELVRKMLGKSVCVAYLCGMFTRIKAYFRRHRILMAEMEEWEKFMDELRKELAQDGDNKRRAGNYKGDNACPKSD